MKILRRRGDEDDTRCCVDDDSADVEILRRVDARILRRRCRDGDLYDDDVDTVNLRRSRRGTVSGSRRMKLDNCSRLFD